MYLLIASNFNNMEIDKISNFEHMSLHAMIVELTTLPVFTDRTIQALAIFSFPQNLSMQKKVLYLRSLLFKLSDLLEERQRKPVQEESNIYEEDLKSQLIASYKYFFRVDESLPGRYDLNTFDENKRIAAAFQDFEIDGLKDWLNKSIDHIVQTLIAFISVDDFNTSRISQTQILGVLQRAKDDISEIDRLKNAAMSLIGEIQTLPTRVTIDRYSEMFSREAMNFRTAAVWWLSGILLCLAGIISTSIFYAQIVSDQKFASFTLNQVVQFNITKVLTLTALFYGLTICNKNFKSSKHNEIINKHRGNALASFQAFVEAPTADSSTKNAVLLEATKTIYSAQSTGYLASENEDSPNKFVEVIQNLQSKNQ
jgi:hypothetical protein